MKLLLIPLTCLALAITGWAANPPVPLKGPEANATSDANATGDNNNTEGQSTEMS